MVTILPIVCILSGCAQQAPKPTTTTTNEAATARIGRDGLWDRRRQCAAAIDEVLKHTGWDKPTGGLVPMGASNHYNEADDRCYVRVEVMNRQANEKIGIPAFSYTIFDAFDAGTTLYCSDDLSTSAGFCSIDQPGKEAVNDCVHCRAVAKELMTK
jgi:hypothetical protein